MPALNGGGVTKNFFGISCSSAYIFAEKKTTVRNAMKQQRQGALFPSSISSPRGSVGSTVFKGIYKFGAHCRIISKRIQHNIQILSVPC